MKRTVAPAEGEWIHDYWKRIGGSFGITKGGTWWSRAWNHGEKFGAKWVAVPGHGSHGTMVATYNN
jgi:hypothetical protein